MTETKFLMISCSLVKKIILFDKTEFIQQIESKKWIGNEKWGILILQLNPFQLYT